jgi:hypothetical protein
MQLGEMASRRKEDFRNELEHLQKRHLDVIHYLVPDEKTETTFSSGRNVPQLSSCSKGVFLLQELSKKNP